MRLDTVPSRAMNLPRHSSLIADNGLTAVVEPSRLASGGCANRSVADRNVTHHLNAGFDHVLDDGFEVATSHGYNGVDNIAIVIFNIDGTGVDFGGSLRRQVHLGFFRLAQQGVPKLVVAPAMTLHFRQQVFELAATIELSEVPILRLKRLTTLLESRCEYALACSPMRGAVIVKIPVGLHGDCC